MTSLILQTATRLLLPLLLLYSLFLLLRGHNEPGGGFPGGLVAGAAFTLYALAFGVPAARHALRLDPRLLIGAGLVVAFASSCMPLLAGKPFLTGSGFWYEREIPGLGQLAAGPPVVFDLGVYLVVVGVTLTIILTLAED